MILTRVERSSLLPIDLLIDPLALMMATLSLKMRTGVLRERIESCLLFQAVLADEGRERGVLRGTVSTTHPPSNQQCLVS